MGHKVKLDKIAIGFMIAMLAVVLFNYYQISQIRGIGSGNSNSLGLATASAAGAVAGTESSSVDVIPKGVPEIYGSELGVSYDDVSASDLQLAESTIAKLGNLDTSIELEGDSLKRYIAITSRISCEYCCGAQSIIFSNGQPACGCAHSYAMRGLAKHLIKNHGDEYSDDAVLEELGKWKTLFFPGKIGVKAKVLQDKGIELNYINLASNKYRGVENEAASSGSGSGMVGGC